MARKTTMTLDIRLNGEARKVAAGTTLAGLLEELKLAPERVAIELDRVIVRRDFWGGTVVEDGAEVEVVMFVGGG